MWGLRNWYLKCAQHIISHSRASEKSSTLVHTRRLSFLQNGFHKAQKITKKPKSLYSFSYIDKQWIFNSTVQNKIQNYFGEFNKLTRSCSIHQKHLKNILINFNFQKRFYNKVPRHECTKEKPLPKLLYIQNPVVWVSNKLDFRFLRLSWDPSFTETEFTRGTRQAISTVTQMISKNNFDSMKPLLTKNALLNLRRDVEIMWADEVRRNIALLPQDVQLVIPRKLHFRHSSDPLSLNAPDIPKLLEIPLRPSTWLTTNKKVVDKRFCDIDVLFIGLKRLEEHNSRLIYVDIIARFHRNYSEGMVPDWTISAFKVRRFYVIPKK